MPSAMGAGIVARARHFLLFAALGAVGTGAQYAVLVGLVSGLGVGPVTGSTAGFLAGALTNYTLNRTIAFRSSKPHSETAPKFFAIAGIGLVLNAMLMGLLTHQVGLPYLLAQIVSTVILVVWHYAANALWTFREHPLPEAPTPV